MAESEPILPALPVLDDLPEMPPMETYRHQAYQMDMVPIPVYDDSSDSDDDSSQNSELLPPQLPQLVSKQSTFKTPEDGFDVLYLTSEPLLRWPELKPIVRLNLDEEATVLKECLEESNIQLKFCHDVAYFLSLQKATHRGCKVIHYSGHSMKGVLCFENPEEIGIASTIAQKLVRRCIVTKEGRVNVQLIVLASCHSESIGQTFVDAGCPHVIAIKQETPVADTAARQFLKAFYDALFHGRNVYDSFWLGKDNVYDKHEAKKFILLPKGEQGHRDEIFNPEEREKGKYIDSSKCSAPTNVTSKQLFGREQVMRRMLKLVMDAQVTVVSGRVGIGKTSIIKDVAVYFRKHFKFRKGVIYVDFLEEAEHFNSISIPYILLRTIIRDIKPVDIQDSDLEKIYRNFEEEVAEHKIIENHDFKGAQKLLDKMFRKMKLLERQTDTNTQSLLLIFENADFLLLDSEQWAPFSDEQHFEDPEDRLDWQNENWDWLKHIKDYNKLSVLISQNRRSSLINQYTLICPNCANMQIKAMSSSELTRYFIHARPGLMEAQGTIQDCIEDHNITKPYQLDKVSFRLAGAFTMIQTDKHQVIKETFKKIFKEDFDEKRHIRAILKRLKLLEKLNVLMEAPESLKQKDFFNRSSSKSLHSNDSIHSLGTLHSMPSMHGYPSSLRQDPRNRQNSNSFRQQPPYSMPQMPNHQSYTMPLMHPSSSYPIKPNPNYPIQSSPKYPIQPNPSYPIQPTPSYPSSNGTDECLLSQSEKESRIEKFKKAFKYDCILPHGLKVWVESFNVSRVPIDEVLKAMDRYVRRTLDLKTRGLFWNIEFLKRMHSPYIEQHETFNQWAAVELKHMINFHVGRREFTKLKPPVKEGYIHVVQFAFVWRARLHSLLETIGQLRNIWEKPGAILGFTNKTTIQRYLQQEEVSPGNCMIRFSAKFLHQLILCHKTETMAIKMDKVPCSSETDVIMDFEQATHVYDPYTRTSVSKKEMFGNKVLVRSDFKCCILKREDDGRQSYCINADHFMRTHSMRAGSNSDRQLSGSAEYLILKI